MKRLSYYTIIGRSPSLLSWHLDNLTRNAGLDRSDYDLNIVIYRNKKIPKETTNAIIDICADHKTNMAFYDEPHDWFLGNLYTCWNIGYNMGSAPIVLRGGSDQAWSPNSFKNIVDAHERYTNQELVTQVQSVESPVAGPGSRHWIKPFGCSPADFDEAAFNKFAEETGREGLYTIQEALSIWGHPTSFDSSLGKIDRVDGLSWTMSRKLFEKVGPMPPMERGFTGDVIIHDRIQLLGITEFLVGNAFSYHLVRGESAGHTQ